MDQDRRDAAAWAKEWQIRQKNRRLLMVLGALLAIAFIGYMINFTIVHVERTTFKSVEDMRKAMQGRYAIERDYEDIIIEGDEIVLTYLSYSHYDRDYAERYGYDYSGDDSVYDDHIVEWDYRNGVIKTQWMGDIIVDKNGNIRRGDRYYSTHSTRQISRVRSLSILRLSVILKATKTQISPQRKKKRSRREKRVSNRLRTLRKML